ncbi:hypothetical protein [Embleya sp. NBC_00896]|uniref:hypothetical protein n=1 Tax=Embleya sp. NBC_00896 TaxID=2975961 RepID=UPI002F90FD8C|nr:hypothetical protein OG928_35325 [Embleya sp. NBC_00896]
MIIIGLLLGAASAAFAALLIAYNTTGGPEYTVSMFDRDMATLDTLSAFLAGLALALLFCAALAMVAAGARRRRHIDPGRAADRRLSERAARHAAAHEWQADPTGQLQRSDIHRDPPPPPAPPEPPSGTAHNR